MTTNLSPHRPSRPRLAGPMSRKGATKRADVQGQVMVLFALFSFVLVGALALALDVGYLLSERREAQAAADAAALAGARALLAGESSSAVTQAAQDYARDNGVAASSDSSTVDVIVTGDRWDGNVAVDLTVNVQRFFLGALYTGPWDVSAHAVAVTGDFEDGRYALIALDPPGIHVNGDMTVGVTGGGIISNDNITSSGSSNVISTDGFLDAVGSIDDGANNWQADWGIREKRAPALDPFTDYIAPPKPLGPPNTGNYRCNPKGYEDPSLTGPDCSFFPGYYKNATIRIWDLAVFAPGLYYFENSRIELRSQTARVEGIGVNFYFTGDPDRAYFDPQNGEVYLTAPGWSADPALLTIHGDYHDLVLWFDMCPGPTFNSQGNQEFFIGGGLYAPCSQVYLHGNPYGDTVSGIVVASTVEMRGTSDMAITYLPYAPTPSYEIWLVE